MTTLTIELTDEQASTLQELASSPDAVAGGLVMAVGGWALGEIATRSITGIFDSISNPRIDYGSVDVIGA